WVRRRLWRRNWPTVRPLHMASPRPACTRNGQWISMPPLRPKRRHRRSACRPRTSPAPIAPLRRSRNRFSRATEMADRSYLSWPFFEDRHRALAAKLQGWARQHANHHDENADIDAVCRSFVKQLGRDGFLGLTVPKDGGGTYEKLEVR